MEVFQYQAGWSIVGLTSVNIAVNMGVMVFKTV